MTDQFAISTRNRGLQLTTFDDMARFAKGVIASQLAPRHFNSPEKVIVAMQYGLEVGLSPMQSLQSIAVINGRPSLWGDALPALAWASGKLAEVSEYFDGEGENLTAVCETLRVGQSKPAVRRFSVSDAKRAGLWDKAGPWTQYPQRMLQMRARAWCFRDNLADVLCGLQVAEEATDMPDISPANEQATGLSMSTFDDGEQMPEADTFQLMVSEIEGAESIDRLRDVYRMVQQVTNREELDADQAAKLQELIDEKVDELDVQDDNPEATGN